MTALRRPRIGADSAHSWARNLVLGNPHAKGVLMMCCFYVNDEGACTPGIATLAQDTELSEQTVRSRLRWLEEIGAVVRVPCWIDQHGRRTYESTGGRKRTSDEIRLMIHADPEDIEARAKAPSGSPPTEEPTDDETPNSPESKDDNPLPSTGDSAPGIGLNAGLNPVSPTPALRQPYDSVEGLKNLNLELKKDSPPNPPPGGGLEIPLRIKAWLDEFATAYPIELTAYEKVARWAISANDADLADSILAAKGYAAFHADLKKHGRTRNVKDAHRWLQSNDWRGFLPKAEQRIEAASRIQVAENSPEWTAWDVFARCCGARSLGDWLPSFRIGSHQGKLFADLPCQWPPLVGDGSGEWAAVPEGSGQYAAWRRRLCEGNFPPRISFRQRQVEGKWVNVLIVPMAWEGFPPPKGTGNAAPDTLEGELRREA